jgi:hypothetical protein
MLLRRNPSVPASFSFQAQQRWKSDVAKMAQTSLSVEEKKKEFAHGPDLSDFVSGSISKEQTWENYRGLYIKNYLLQPSTA